MHLTLSLRAPPAPTAAMASSLDGNNPFADVTLDVESQGTADLELQGNMNTSDPFQEDEGYSDRDQLIDGAASSSNTTNNSDATAPKPSGMCSCLSVAFYQPYFDVDTAAVRQRLTRSVTGFWNRDFLDLIGDKPDLYGPFWILTTLIFVIGATSNFSAYLSFVPSASQARWTYDFTLVTAAAGFVYGFGVFVPSAIWLFSKYAGVAISLMQAICLYGYAHSIYIVAAFFCMVPSDILGWVSIGVATASAVSFVGLNLKTRLQAQHHEQRTVKQLSAASTLLGGVVLMLCVFSIFLKIWFFKHVTVSSDAGAGGSGGSGGGSTPASN